MISSWCDRRILPGEEWDYQINENLNTADIILLLISSDFLFSKYCWDVEVKKAIERHEVGEACVIPVILRSVDWSGAPFAKLQALPKNAEPVVSRNWHNQDEAFTDVARGIRAAAEKLKKERDEGRQKKEADKLQLEHQSTSNDLFSEKGVDYTRLCHLLKFRKWKEADRETLAVMLKATGRQHEGWLDLESITNFPCTGLRTIDQLWVKYSNGHFGFSVQKRIWENVGEDYTEFSDRVGWRMKEKWLSYSNLTFTTSSPRGHLPAKIVQQRVGSGGLKRKVMVFGFGLVGLYSRRVGSLFSRVENLKL